MGMGPRPRPGMEPRFRPGMGPHPGMRPRPGMQRSNGPNDNDDFDDSNNMGPPDPQTRMGPRPRPGMMPRPRPGMVPRVGMRPRLPSDLDSIDFSDSDESVPSRKKKGSKPGKKSKHGEKGSKQRHYGPDSGSRNHPRGPPRGFPRGPRGPGGSGGPRGPRGPRGPLLGPNGRPVFRDPFQVSPAELEEYKKLFKLYDSSHSGFLEASVAAEYLTQSQLPQPILHNIWELADQDHDGLLSEYEFIVATHITKLVKNRVFFCHHFHV